MSRIVWLGNPDGKLQNEDAFNKELVCGRLHPTRLRTPGRTDIAGSRRTGRFPEPHADSQSELLGSGYFPSLRTKDPGDSGL